MCPGAWASACACVHVALLIQHANHMRHSVAPFVATLAPPKCSTLSHTRHDFRKKMLLNLKRVFFLSSLQLLSEIFLILRRIQRDIVMNMKTPLCKVSVILAGF